TGLARGRADVVERRGGGAGERRDVVEQGDETTCHGDLQVRGLSPAFRTASEEQYAQDVTGRPVRAVVTADMARPGPKTGAIHRQGPSTCGFESVRRRNLSATRGFPPRHGRGVE